MTLPTAVSYSTQIAAVLIMAFRPEAVSRIEVSQRIIERGNEVSGASERLTQPNPIAADSNDKLVPNMNELPMIPLREEEDHTNWLTQLSLGDSSAKMEAATRLGERKV